MTKPLTQEDFPAFFRAVHGYDPFPWQHRLVRRLAESDGWPSVLDLPTGSGKTAALDAALFHLALCWDDPGRAALRIVFVVDRRLVVDEAFRRAQRLECTLQCPDVRAAHPVVAEVSSRLARLSGDDQLPLVASRLRGGAPLEHIWARSPTQPVILCSTVDQIGSRLLFRGYGVSDRMRPIHAGLLGENSLILLDEAHIAEPFRQTLEAVRGIGRAGVRQVLLSATAGTTDSEAFHLNAEDMDTPVLRARVDARKRAELRVVRRSGAKAEFADTALNILREIQSAVGGERGVAVGVVVNRVALARDIHGLLCERARNGGPESVRLMIGRSRPADRDSLASVLAPFFTGSGDRSTAKSLIVVATQCLEVGVDIDLDGLVTQAAPLDALRQRFGRLDRAGRGVPDAVSAPRAVVLAFAEDLGKCSDPIYGDRVRSTWEWMQTVAPQGVLDFGVRAMDDLLSHDGVNTEYVFTVRSDAPVVMPAYLDTWVRTSPVPASEPQVDLFLHGAERAAADVMVIWRDDIEEDDLRVDNADRLAEVLSLVPPRAGEMLPVPVVAVRRWLALGKRADDLTDPTGDVSGRQTDSSPPRDPVRSAFRWAGLKSQRTGIVQVNRIRPGDLLVVPAEYGGCDDHGWDPSSQSRVRDLADKAALAYAGRRWAVRIHRSRTGKTAWAATVNVLADRDGRSAKDIASRLEATLGSADLDLDDGGSKEDLVLIETVQGLRRLVQARWGTITLHFPYVDSDDEERGGAVLLAPRGLRGFGSRVRMPPVPTTETDAFGHSFPQSVSLNDHGAHVEGFARKYAQRLRKHPKVESDLALAAFLHDAGKADPRFQVMLSGGGVWNASEGMVLAKSRRDRVPGAWRAAGLPDGWRHEALSVRLAMTHPKFADAHDPELVLWLVATHHGLGRPFFGFVETATPQPWAALDVENWGFDKDGVGPESPKFDFRGADWPEIFRRLRLRYGIWGLAELEAILRLADHRASEYEEKESG